MGFQFSSTSPHKGFGSFFTHSYTNPYTRRSLCLREEVMVMTWLRDVDYIAMIHKSIWAIPHTHKVINLTPHKMPPPSSLLIGQYYNFTSKDLWAYKSKSSDFSEYQQLIFKDLQRPRARTFQKPTSTWEGHSIDDVTAYWKAYLHTMLISITL